MKLINNPVDAFTERLLYSTVDARFNNELGKVTQKNIEIVKDTLSYGKLIAVKHANGKDWWLVTPRRKNNVFYILKFTKDGIVDTFTQSIGIIPDYKTEGYGQIVFSPDGSKIYRTNPQSPIMVYSFDREAGVFTQFDTIYYEYGNQPIIGEIGCAVSPSGRFLYLGCRRFLYQLDLWAPDISASQTVVAVWDGFGDPIPTMFYQLQLGPDCKIYGLGGGDTRFFHIIHSPDEPGLACNVEQRGLPLPTPSGASMPSFPNYRLGPLDNPGLPCTLSVGTSDPAPAARSAVSAYPNPANNEITFEYQFDDDSGKRVLLLYNAFGQVVREIFLPDAKGKVTMHTLSLPEGVYWYVVPGEKRTGLVGKIIINH